MTAPVALPRLVLLGLLLAGVIAAALLANDPWLVLAIGAVATLLPAALGSLGRRHGTALTESKEALAAGLARTREVIEASWTPRSSWTPQDGSRGGIRPPRPSSVGRPPRPWVARSRPSSCPPDQRSTRCQALTRYLATGEETTRGRRLEVAALHRDGHVLLVEMAVAAIGTGMGTTFTTFLRDITAAKAAGRALAEREAQLQAFLDNASDLIVRLTPDGRVEYANHEAAARLASSGTQLVGRLLLQLLSPDHAAAGQAALAQVGTAGRPVPVEWTLQKADSAPLHVEGSLTPRLEGGRLVGVDAILHDVTARQEAAVLLQQSREELRQVNAELQQAAHLKDDFLANMSHELRTPLNAVLGIAEAFQDDVYGPLTEKQRQALTHIEESGRHLLGLINDILDLSKIEAGKLTLEPEPVEVGILCQASLQFVRELSLKKRQTLSSQIDPAVSTLVVDTRRLKQILVNLLTNAVKFTPEGGSVGLEVVGDQEREAVRFTVWDTGIGISQTDMDRLFEPFFQATNPRQHEGTGLGLPLVARLVALHGGGVEVESVPGQGSRFTVRIP